MSVISMSTSTSTWPISVMSTSTSKIYSSTRVLSTSAPCLVVVFLCTCRIVYKYVDTCVCMYGLYALLIIVFLQFQLKASIAPKKVFIYDY